MQTHLKVSARDRYSSFLIAGIVVAGLCTSILILVLILHDRDPPSTVPLIKILDSSKTMKITLARLDPGFDEIDSFSARRDFGESSNHRGLGHGSRKLLADAQGFK